MIWLAWRQFRSTLLVAFAFLVAIAVAYLVTGPSLFHVFHTFIQHCSKESDCPSTINTFSSRDKLLQDLSIFLLIFPALLGIFWGAPLVAREFETGTLRLAWTQGVTRQRWFLTRLGLVLLAAGVVTGLFSFMASWWTLPFRHINNSPWSDFDKIDIVPIGYALFAVALGVLAGVVIRRVVPAMAATLVGFIAVRLWFNDWVRPRLQPALHHLSAYVLPGFPAPYQKGAAFNGSAWDVSDSVINAKGRVIGQNGGIGPNGNIDFKSLGRAAAHGAGNLKTEFVGVGVCPNTFPRLRPRIAQGHLSIGNGVPNNALTRATTQCVKSFHLRELITYQPGSRFWPFQWEECALYAVAAIILGLVSLWLLKKRRA